MKRQKILFLLGDIWSLGKNKGMPSVYKVLEKSHECMDITIFTTDVNTYESELPNANIKYFKKGQRTFKNRFIVYFVNRVQNIILNLKYIVSFLLTKKDFDILYCSSSVPIYATMFIKKFYKIKILHRIYGTFLYPNLGHKLDELKKFEEVLSFKAEADHYIITNDGTHGDKVAGYYGIEKQKISFLRNGINEITVSSSLEEIYDKYYLDKNDFHLLCVSRLVNWKRVDRIVKAVNLITNKRIKLLVVGNGEELENLTLLATNENITFVGSVAATEVQELMSITDIFISMYDLSNVGNPLLEALSFGLPIITYNSGDTREIINGENGILISSDDEDEIIKLLKENILNLYNDEIKRKNYRNNALKYAEKNLLSWDKRIDLEMEIIKRVIDEK
jgi:glycosyltransferase involved in cell wall biosynthesis